VIAEGEWVAVRTTCDGAHSSTPEIPVNRGMFDGVEPTVRFYPAQHKQFRIVDARLKEHWAN
jgi:hypothetical protein